MKTTAHLAILGMSFTGSTIVSYALGALPGCSTVNEVHWLRDNPNELCAKCGKSCLVWSPKFRTYLQSTPCFYSDIRARLGAEVLISCDKDPAIYDRLQPVEDRNYLMLYREPLAQSGSALKAAADEGSSTDLADFLDYWVDKNTQILVKLSGSSGNFLMRLEDFQANPDLAVDKLCRAFGLPYTSAWKMYWEKPQHPIGGNFNPWSCLDSGELDRIKIRAVPPANQMPNPHRDSSKLLDLLDGHRLNIRQL